MTAIPDVQPGQVWADNDSRVAGRTIRVESIEDGKAICTVLTNSTKAQADLDAHGGKFTGWSQDTRSRTTKISLARFKPTRTGYRLIKDSGEQQWPS